MSVFLRFLVSLIKTPLTHLLAFFAGKQSGQKAEQHAQRQRDLEAISKAEHARRYAERDSMHHDRYNRDN